MKKESEWIYSQAAMNKQKVTVSVINDLVTDRRVEKICNVWLEHGYEVHLIGRQLTDSLPISRSYKVTRMKLLLNKGALFYAFFNIRLFFKLFTSNPDVYYANDLDTLLANSLASRMRGKPLIYDSHEYFTEVPELLDGSFAKRTWLRLEKGIFPRLKHVITVNESIAKIYREKYGVDVKVMRNLPERSRVETNLTRNELGIPEDKGVLIIQGSGINVDRGAEEMVEAMQFLPNFHLLIIGGGDVIDHLKMLQKQLNLENITFHGKMPYDQMMAYTANSDLGITLDKDTNLNYKYSLPNKIFDYLKAGIPVLSSNLPELSKVVKTYGVGCITPNHEPKTIAQTIEAFFSNHEYATQCTLNASQVCASLNWETESKVLSKIIEEIEQG